MRPRLEQLAIHSQERSFLCNELSYPAFEFYWHYHPEWELTYILKGSGNRLVGNSFESFEAGDLVLLPPHLPHTWVSEAGSDSPHEAVILQFKEELLKPFLGLPEFSSVRVLLQKADCALFFPGIIQTDFPMHMKSLSAKSGLEAFLAFLHLLAELSETPFHRLTDIAHKPLKIKEDECRINKIFAYVQSDFGHTLSIQSAAKQVHLSDSAFCKFFKRLSGRTFSDYVNEVRIAHACYLLLGTDLPVAQIAIQSGYESLTYFNRIFLRKKGRSPRNFRERG